MRIIGPIALIGMATGSAFFAASTIQPNGNGGPAITEETHIPLKSAVAIGVFASTMVWWTAKRIQKIEDDLESATKGLPQTTVELQHAIQRICNIEATCQKNICSVSSLRHLPPSDVSERSYALLVKQVDLLEKIYGLRHQESKKLKKLDDISTDFITKTKEQNPDLQKHET